jgi:hypothetical protein
MGGTHRVERDVSGTVSRQGLFLWLAVACAWVCVAAVPGAASAAGCVVTFRHGEVVRGDSCEDAGDAVAYVRFGGWVVVRKSALVSIADETGVTRFYAPWTPAEAWAQLQGLPTEGGVPVAPAAVGPPPPPPLQESVVYVPVPDPAPTQNVYQVDGPAVSFYPAGVASCRHCLHPPKARHAPPTASPRHSRSPAFRLHAVPRSLPSISPMR